MRIKFLIVILFCLIILFKIPHTFAEFTNLNPEQPIDIEADTIYYDSENNIVRARGNVYIEQGNQSIIAQEILYNRITEDLYLYKDVAIKREDGNIFFSDKAVLNRKNKDGIIINFKGRMGTQGLIASNSAEVINEKIIELDNAVYSPCSICKENLVDNQPLWQVRAKKVTINKDDEKVYYKDATIESYGIPFFYFPYLSTPSPGAKRKSGLLTPKFSYSQEFGSGLKLPYYFNIAPNFDITYAPLYFQKETSLKQKEHFLHDFEVRHLSDYGPQSLRVFMTNTHKIDKNASNISPSKSWRGFYDYTGGFKFPILRGTLNIDSKMLRDNTKTFAKKYKINTEDVLKSDLNYQELAANYHLQVRSLFFQDLRPNTSRKTTPLILPNLGLYYNNPIGYYNLNSIFELNYLNLTRPQGSTQHRFVGVAGLEKKMILKHGFLFKTKGSVRGDLYQVDYKPVKVNSGYKPQNPNASGSETRFYPEFLTELSWPLFKSYDKSKIIVEPVIMGILSPDVRNLRKADNEDSQDPEISAVNLFSANRYKGYDRLESGNRFNYGLRTNIKSNWFHNLNFTVGQNYRFKKDSNFHRISGLNKLYSDYVAKISFQPTPDIYINDALRIERKGLSILRHELSLTLNKPKYNASLHYAAVNGTIIDDPNKLGLPRQEVVLSGSYNFYRKWWIDAAIIRKVGKKRPDQKTPMISDSIGFKHLTECLNTTITISRDYTKLKDLKPTTTYIFNIEVPTF